ncbi:MAG: hypothetical protein WBQ94_13920 [Terracidiphilus sp.]
MKSYVIVPLLTGAIAISSSAPAQQTTPTAVSYLQESLTAMVGKSTVQDVTLNGTAETISGSTDETGSFIASCAVNGSSRLELQLSSVSRTETRQTTNGVLTGIWVDSHGEQHLMAGHNLVTPQAWFCPDIALARFLQDSSLAIQFMGNESKNGAAADHFSIAAPAADKTAPNVLIAHLTRVDLFLDPATLRPVALDFNIHPDNNALIDIPVEIRFSNYASVDGVWIPFTVEKYVNSTLALKLQVNSASTATASSTNQ